MGESVARKLAAPRWLPNTPSLSVWPNGEWADSTGKRTDLKFELSPWTPVPVRVSIAPTPSAFAFGEAGQGNSIRGSDQRIVALVSVSQTLIITNVRL